jgi:hypothetical protein
MNPDCDITPDETRVSLGKKKMPKWILDDLIFALENAAEFLENEEFPDNGEQELANKEGKKQSPLKAGLHDRKN